MALLEADYLPDVLIKAGIRQLLKERLRREKKADPELQHEHFMRFLEGVKKGPIAVNTADANVQHYEVPTEFFRLVLGKHMKYSCGYWEAPDHNLDQSEEAMLELTCERARLENGQSILDLGCGWGALSLFVAEKYPEGRIVAVSNSKTQRLYIEAEARRRSLTNLQVIAADMNLFHSEEKFDRIVSVEMFEHMRNYQRLLEKLSDLLHPGGKLFIHVFTHREHAYLFEVEDETDWMSQHFFTGGMMPSEHLLLYFPDRFKILNHWKIGGLHYRRTLLAWLRRMDERRAEIMPLLAQTYGMDQARKWWVYWRVFFIACAELFGFRDGAEWFVSHYLFEKR